MLGLKLNHVSKRGHRLRTHEGHSIPHRLATCMVCLLLIFVSIVEENICVINKLDCCLL